MIAGLLLAAGRSTRFGSDKLLANVGGRAVIARSASALSEAVDALFVVLPPEPQSRAEALDNVEFRVVINRRNDGMGSSIAAGVAALPDSVEAVMISLGDQPTMNADVAHALVASWRSTRAPVIAPAYRDGRGHPVLFSRECFPRLAALGGDRGAASVVAAMGGRVVMIPFEEDAPADVDTPEALSAVTSKLQRPDS